MKLMRKLKKKNFLPFSEFSFEKFVEKFSFKKNLNCEKCFSCTCKNVFSLLSANRERIIAILEISIAFKEKKIDWIVIDIVEL